jgi:hypothetical protein
MKTLLTFALIVVISSLNITYAAQEKYVDNIPNYVGNVINPQEILPIEASASLNHFFYNNIRGNKSIQDAVNALMLKEYVNQKGVYLFSIGKNRAENFGFSMKTLMDYASEHGGDKSFQQFLIKEGIIISDAPKVEVAKVEKQVKSEKKTEATVSKKVKKSRVIGAEVEASTDENGMYAGTLIRYTEKPDTNIKSYFLELKDGEIMRIDTWRDLRDFIGDTIEIEIEGTKEDFVLKKIYHESLAGTGPTYTLLFLMFLVSFIIYFQRRKI